MSTIPPLPFKRGRLSEVTRLTDEMVAARERELQEVGDCICTECDWRGKEDTLILVGTFAFNEVTKQFDVPSGTGRVIYRCPRCGSEDRSAHTFGNEKGILFLSAWVPFKGEWRLRICQQESCLDKGKPYIELCCPICGTFYTWHHASNGPDNRHSWSVVVENDKLTMNPSLFENPPTGCHYFIRNGRVE